MQRIAFKPLVKTSKWTSQKEQQTYIYIYICVCVCVNYFIILLFFQATNKYNMHTTHEQHVSEGCSCQIYYILDSIVAFRIFMSFGGLGDSQSNLWNKIERIL